MSENNEKTDNTLKIGGSRLTLNRPLDGSQIRQNIHGKSNTVTVVKKKRIFTRDDEQSESVVLNHKQEADQKFNVLTNSSERGLTEHERSVRLNALKNAAENSKVFESKDLSREEETPDIEIDDVYKEESVIVESEQSSPGSPALGSEQDASAAYPSQRTDRHKQGGDEDEEEGEKSKNKVKIDTKSAKSKFDHNRRSSGKINVNTVLDDEESEKRTRSLASLRRAKEKARKAENDRSRIDSEKIVREVIVPELISVGELANRMSVRTTDVIKELMKLGMIATANQDIDVDTAEIIVETFGHKIKKVSDSDIEKILDFVHDEEASLQRRAPVVTIMGHVDHGKTSLLDALRATDVVSGEAGGITQHIGAYRIQLEGGEAITFIDTPGHEAFTAMRSRGAKATDIVVLVVAADDGIMEQTKEAINHAKAANVPIIVAINKIDKPDSEPQKVRNELLSYDIVLEEFGGEVMAVEVSAKAKINLDKLEEAILLQAEMLDLRANPMAEASGVVIESKMDKNKGIVATLLVQRGTLKVGDIVVAGAGFGKVKTILDDKGNILDKATPSMPVEVLGFGNSPEAGEKFVITGSEKQARDLAEYREKKDRIRRSTFTKGTLEELFAQSGPNSKIKEMALIIKGDVQGSIEAIIGTLAKLPDDEVKIKILHTGVGGITQSDVILASASNAIILGFNVRADSQARLASESNRVDIRYYSIIYNLVDDMKAVLGGMLSPIIREIYTGSVKILQVFNITKAGKIAGCTVTEGVIRANSNVRILRDSIVVHEGKIKTLKRYKEDAKEVKEGQECGIALENYEDLKDNDVIEVFELKEEKKQVL